MGRVHFAYTVHDTAGYSSRGLPTEEPLWRRAALESLRWPSPVHAPYSITYHTLSRLRENFDTLLYDIAEKTQAEMEPQDLFLGHLYPKAGSFGGQSMEPDFDTVGWRTLKRYGRGRTCLIQPFVYCPEIVEMSWLEPAFTELCDSFIAICGEYWGRRWKECPLSANNRNFLRVNMCVDAGSYPWVRKSFRPKGKRRFLYVGHNRPYKNTVQLEKIARQMPGFEGGCLGSLDGWHQLSNEHVPLTPTLMAQLAEHFDVFLSTSTADAQATTILEQMSSGFVIACTPQSGYEHESIVKLDPHDTVFNCAQLQRIQEMEDEELMQLALTNRRLIESEYSWSQVSRQIVTFVKDLMEQR